MRRPGGGTWNSKGAPSWPVRALPPAGALGVALALAAAVLPSAFTLPQTDPTETAEYAPVPPSEDAPPDHRGDLNALGEASTPGVGVGPSSDDGSLPGQEGGDAGSGGVGKSPSTKRCVHHPDGLRQTEDPLSPPCVADFRADNGGELGPGVTRDEIRILITVQGAKTDVNACAHANQHRPNQTYYDLALPPGDHEHCLLGVLRTLQRYFEDRYQTYLRRPHFFVYFSGSGTYAEERRAEAAENHARIQPFAVVSHLETFEEAYLDEMARRGVLNFGAYSGRTADFYDEYPGRIWGFQPSIEEQAELFSSYLCRQVAPFPVSFGGNLADQGKPRRFGLWSADDPAHPELRKVADLVETLVGRDCGVSFTVERTFPEAGRGYSNHHTPAYATSAAADFSSAGVTTIVWPAGLETNLTKQMAAIGYRPEIVALGDGLLEADTAGALQDQTTWDGAHVVTPLVADVGELSRRHCFQATREVDPEADTTEIKAFACPFYDHFRQLFTGIQVAGPRLSPITLERGFRAIPAIESTDPGVPACFYDPGDYTCVKDAFVERWEADRDGGCYLATEGGRRYFTGTWPAQDVVVAERGDDPCNRYDRIITINPAPPSDPGV